VGDMEGVVEVQSVDLDRDGLYFLAREPNTNYWVYVDAEDRFVKVFNSLVDALAYGLHVSPGEITEVVADGDKLRVCLGSGCLEFKAWVD